MKKFAIAGFLAVLVAAGIGPAAASEVCPSTLPSCGSTGNASLLSGSFACVGGGATSGGGEKSTLVLVTFSPGASGAGTFTGESADNSNNGTSGTYDDFTASGQTLSGSYCINADNVTGYLLPGAGNGCPVAFGLTSGQTLLRLLDTSEGKEGSLVCRHQ